MAILQVFDNASNDLKNKFHDDKMMIKGYAFVPDSDRGKRVTGYE